MNAEEAPGPDGTNRTDRLIHGALTETIIGAFYEVYNHLGTGLLEKAYCGALAHELSLRGLSSRREVPTDIWYKGKAVARYRTDFVVEERVVLEIKSTRHLNVDDHRQLLNYLRATHWEVGLLFHFGPKPLFYRSVSTNDDPLKYGSKRSRVLLPRSSAESANEASGQLE
jgi:GxxExxY protein